jgi:K+ transporter
MDLASLTAPLIIFMGNNAVPVKNSLFSYGRSQVPQQQKHTVLWLAAECSKTTVAILDSLMFTKFQTNVTKFCQLNTTSQQRIQHASQSYKLSQLMPRLWDAQHWVTRLLEVPLLPVSMTWKRQHYKIMAQSQIHALRCQSVKRSCNTLP